MKLFNIIICYGLLICTACTYENELEKYGITDCTTVTFTDDVQPLINTNCAISGCHLGNSGLVNFSQPAIIKAEAADIRSRTQSGNMPPPGSGLALTQEEIDQISCWVQNGAEIN